MQKFEVERAAEPAANNMPCPWRIWVGGLPKNANEKHLAAYFSMFGTLTECKIMTDNSTGQSRGFAYISFQEKESFDRVIGLKDHNFNKTKLSISVYQSKEQTDRKSAEENERKIFLVNMHYKTKRSTVEDYFSRFGEIERVDLKTHHGIGFITFKERLSAIRCFQSEDVHSLDGRTIECRPVLSKGELKEQYNANRERTNAKKLQALGLFESQSHSDKRQKSEHSVEPETRPRNHVQISTLLHNFQISAQGGIAKSRYSENSVTSNEPNNEEFSNRGSEGTRSLQHKVKPNSRASEGKHLSGHAKGKPTNDDMLKTLGFLDDEEEEDAALNKKAHIDLTSTEASGLPYGVDRSTLRPLAEQKKKLSLSERFNSDRIARSYFDPTMGESTFEQQESKKVKSDIVEVGKSGGMATGSFSGQLASIPEEQKKYESTFLDLPK